MDATGENDVALRYTLLGFLDKFQFLIWGTPNEAAIKLHKFYKRFGTRWKLAGCAVFVEKSCYLLVFWSQNFWCYCVCRDLMLYDKSPLFQSQAETLRLWWGKDKLYIILWYQETWNRKFQVGSRAWTRADEVGKGVWPLTLVWT